MSWHRLFAHDLRCGLLRVRYLLTPLIFILPCLFCWMVGNSMGLHGTWMDYLANFFKGIEPIRISDTMEHLQLPILWLLTVGGCLLLNLDYLLNDLTNEGQQIILRSGSRTGWFLSKCVWNLCSCTLYFCLMALTALLFTLLTGGKVSCELTHAIAESIYGLAEASRMETGRMLLASVFVPFLTVAAFSILQMTLCLFFRPVIAFFVCMSMLIVSVYCPSAIALGNGAMAVRSSLLAENGVEPVHSTAVAIMVVVSGIAAGCLRIRRMDILGQEE